MRRVRPCPLLLLLALAAACAPARAPLAAPERAPEAGAAEPPPADPGRLEPETRGLLQRLLVEGAPEAPAAVGPDPRPVCLDLGFQAGAGPFRVAGRELPPAAAELALSEALRAAFAAGGPLAGPRAVGWEELYPPGIEPVLRPPLEREVCEAGLALGGRYLIAGRVLALEHERVAVWLPLGERFEQRERGLVRVEFELFDLERGQRVREGAFERRYDLDGLSPAQLASAERLLAGAAAELIAADLSVALEGPPEAPARAAERADRGAGGRGGADG